MSRGSSARREERFLDTAGEGSKKPGRAPLLPPRPERKMPDGRMGSVDAEKLYSWLAGATSITVFIFDIVQRKTLYSNRRLVEQLGYTQAQLQELGADKPSDFLHPDDVELFESSMERQRNLADQEVAQGIYRFRKSNGSYAWLSTWSSPLTRNPDGHVCEVFGVAFEVTEQREAELRLARSEANLSALLENTKDAIFSVDRDHRLLAFNTAFARVFREAYGTEVRIGLRVVDVLGEKQQKLWIERVTRALAGERFSIQERAPIGGRAAELQTSFNPIVTVDGSVDGVAVFSRDVTGEKRIERALLEAESRLRVLADRALDVVAVYRVKPEPRQEYISPSVEKLVGYSPQEFYDDPHMHLRLVHPEDRGVLAEFMQQFPKGTDGPVKFRWIHKNGSVVWVELTLVPIFDEHGELTAVESISRDVTANVELEEQLRQSQKLDAVGRLAGGIAHDFNNLLGIVMGNVELARRTLDDKPAAAEHLASIEDAAQRGATLTRQLLSFSRPQVARPQFLDLNESITNIQSMLSRLLREDVRVTLELAPALPRVRCDPGQLEQLLLNLAVNARDAMPDGGELVIRTHGADECEDLVSTPVCGRKPAGGVVALSVRDTGVGMDPAILGRAFEEFFTTKSRGTGLGLSIVRRIAESNGGAIGVESAVGRGSKFTVVFPRVADPPGSVRRITPGKAHKASGGTVLLVEDEEPLRRLARVILESDGYRVIESRSAQEAIEIARERLDEIDLLLTDVVMPEMNGRALSERLLELRPALRVLYMSGYSDDPSGQPDSRRDEAQLISKPFSASELLARVAQALERREKSVSVS